MRNNGHDLNDDTGTDVGTIKEQLDTLREDVKTLGRVTKDATRDEHGAVIPFHILVQMPAAAEPYRAVVRRIVNVERPAHVTYDIAVQPPPPDNTPRPDSSASADPETTSESGDKG